MNNAVLCEKGSMAKGILCLDPQGEANRWFKRMHHGAGLVVTKQTSSMFSRHIESAIKEGKVILIEGLNPDLEVSIMQLLDSYRYYRLSSLREDFQLKFDGKSYKALSTFKILLTCSQETPHFTAALQNSVLLVNFEVTLESLQSKLLSMIIGAEKKDLEEKYTEACRDAYEHFI